MFVTRTSVASTEWRIDLPQSVSSRKFKLKSLLAVNTDLEAADGIAKSQPNNNVNPKNIF